MTIKKSLLLGRMEPPEENEANWNNWYNGTHVAARVRIPGFLSARRFTKIEGLPREYATTGEAKYLALAVVNYIYTLVPRKVIMGGGIMKKEGFLSRIQEKVITLLHGYGALPESTEEMADYIVLPGLGELSGVLGAIALTHKSLVQS